MDNDFENFIKNNNCFIIKLDEKEIEELIRIRMAHDDISNFLYSANNFENSEVASDFLESVCNIIYQYKLYEFNYFKSLKEKYKITNFNFCPEHECLIVNKES